MLRDVTIVPGSKLSVSRSIGSEASSRRALVTISLSPELVEDSGVPVVVSEFSELIFGELTSKVRE